MFTQTRLGQQLHDTRKENLMDGGVRSLCTAGSLRGDAAARLRAGLAGGRGGGRRLFQGETAACMDRQVEALASSNLGADVRGQACSV